MVIVSSDVTNPGVKPFIVADHIQSNGDGSVSFVSADGQTFYGQEPNQYGVANNNTYAGPYQKWTRQGALVTTVTRPGDQMFTYTVAEGQSY